MTSNILQMHFQLHCLHLLVSLLVFYSLLFFALHLYIGQWLDNKQEIIDIERKMKRCTLLFKIFNTLTQETSY